MEELQFDGVELKNLNSLSFYKIGPHAIIWLLKDLIPIQINVLTLMGKTIGIEINWWFTVLDLKRQIMGKEGTKLDQQRLIFGGKQLEELRPVTDYAIWEGSTVQMAHKQIGAFPRPKGSFNAYARTSFRRTLQIVTRSDEMILDLKRRISEHRIVLGKLPHQYRLKFKGKQLADGRTLSDYNIHHESTVRLIMEL